MTSLLNYKTKYLIMINIAIYNNSAHSVLHYRTFGPLSKLRRVWNEISLIPITPNQTEMSVLYNCDILLINRPATKKEYDIILNAKSAGCKIWVDIDDYIQEISIYNPAYGTYQPDNIEYYLESINEADLITVSTHKLNELTPNSIVVPNGIEPIFKEPVMKRDKLTLAWRGTNTHRMDLHLYQDVFKEFARHPNFDVVFYGYLPLWTNDIEVKYRSFTTLPNFFKQWNEDPIDFVFFPLEDNGSPFNLCKSNISWLESTQIGAAFYTNMISSDEFNYKGVGTFIDGLMIDIEGALIQKKNLWEHSVSEIENNFNINEINKFRKHLIQELLL